MLDEVIEYKEYTDKSILDYIVEFNKNEPSSSKRISNRLKYNQMSNDLSGLKRAYTIVAKYFLDKYNDYDIALNALYAYAGQEYNPIVDEINEVANYIDPSLLDFYYRNSINTNANKDVLNNIENMKVKYFRKRLDEDIVNGKSIAEENNISDFNKISFIDIVCNLICKQDNSLKRRMLVCKQDLTSSIINIKNKKIGNKQIDYLLKVIATYLLFNKDNGMTKIKMADVYNWILYNPETTELNEYVFTNNEKPIIKNNFNRMVFIDLHKTIKDNYYLLDFKDVDKVNYGNIVYLDRGSRQTMLRIDIENSYDKMNLLQELKDIS